MVNPFLTGSRPGSRGIQAAPAAPRATSSGSTARHPPRGAEGTAPGPRDPDGTRTEPAGHAPRWLADAVTALVVTGVSLAGSYAASWHQHGQTVNVAGYLLVAAGGAALTARRLHPVAVLAVTLAAALLAGSVGHASMVWLPLIVAFFTAIAVGRRAAAVAALVIGYLVSVWPPWLIGASGRGVSVTYALALGCGLLALLAAAELVRAAAARRQAQQQIRREELRRLATDERLRIARDLHDVVAHNISVINVQANTALHLADRQPERAIEALAVINDVSKQALDELRSVLGVLRGTGESAQEAPRAPAPGLARIGDLVRSAQSAGLAVQVEEDGQPGRLPAKADLAAYRIVQEALTNSARHSGGSRATVRIRYRANSVEIEVDDNGPDSPAGRPARPAGDGTGNGIAGMTERAQALGGSLAAGPRPGGGFRVAARLPVGRSAR